MRGKCVLGRGDSEGKGVGQTWGRSGQIRHRFGADVGQVWGRCGTGVGRYGTGLGQVWADVGQT